MENQRHLTFVTNSNINYTGYKTNSQEVATPVTSIDSTTRQYQNLKELFNSGTALHNASKQDTQLECK